MEKNLQVKLGPIIVFRDSLQLYTFSLDFLIKSLAKTVQLNFFLLNDTMRNLYPGATDEIIQLVGHKGGFLLRLHRHVRATL